MISFIEKKVENMLRSKLWRWHLYFIFVSSGVEYCSRKNLLLANCWRKLKRISFLHWSYDRIWRRLLRIRIRLGLRVSLSIRVSISWNYQWLSCIFRRLQEFWPWLGRLQGARWRTPTCLDGCCCLPSDTDRQPDNWQFGQIHLTF